MNDILSSCVLCPRNCHADRLGGKTGYCGETAEIRIARAALHMWEEPCISSTKGSGTVFFSGCPLCCVYCQNHNISCGNAGRTVTVNRLAEIFSELAQKGAHNINLVTPTHFVPQIIDALDIAKAKGFSLPVVYNTSGYENVETLRLLRGYIDIYLPDFKYMSADISAKYSKALDYADKAKAAIAEMVSQTGEPVFDNDGIIKKGVIVRHLALPGCGSDSRHILKYLHDTYGDHVYISIMNQYTPLENAKEYPELMRKITDKEYENLLDYAGKIGIEKGFVQEGGTAAESFIPEFDYTGV